ncbi:organic hydroperoxide resistance protein [Jonesia denitrificans]|uniref:OsmC family protein n=1 Tax=Jonesia denitrificans (strain ATCC 14870 / DSM 20603 / BCRC 15368 / CIP 55.134 / JCM 11481 / NBRC 15587 / NCTC 10816 / Prevot 55134) TaxID=471856 RepID=C7R3U9_JONDD|nr:organic hydroperoxide resistance protein [Jonesia denitrificans]ACV08806.1 OsmC family protein [Jonesia denitrificans DSM 20603]ASE09872.1 organic hydroperoxide resistance protein [Jonesia denitrificans]SQH20795.1 General stress protein 17o [Jonesia denitrificans]
MNVLYTTEALATGGGRDGHVAVAGTDLAFDLAVPTSMGGSGNGANPEQLFAAGFAACFHSALQLVARQRKVSVDGSSVAGRVSIGATDGGGFGLAVELEVSLPGVDKEVAQEIAEEAHQVCPYSNATRGNIDVTVTVGNN